MSKKAIMMTVSKFFQRHGTKILAGVSIAAEAMGFYFMHREAPVVRKKLDELPPDATAWDKIKTAAPVYWPAGMMFVASAGSTIGCCAAGEIKAAKYEAMAVASNGLIQCASNKLEEKLGKEEADKFRKETEQEYSEKARSNGGRNDGNEIYYTGNGDELFQFPWTLDWFASSEDAVKEAFADFSRLLKTDDWASLNDLRNFLKLKDIPANSIVGYNANYIMEKYGECKVPWTMYPSYAPNGKTGSIIELGIEPVLYNGMRPDRY